MAADHATFGDLVRQARRAAKLSQEDLAERAGLSARGISDLERGVIRTPRVDTVKLLADALGLTADERRRWERARRAAPRQEPHSQPERITARNRAVAKLPVRLTSFVGRERELEDLTVVLSQPSVRLATVIGPGGIGKTSLAVQVATSLEATYQDGAWFISVAAVNDPALVATTMISAAGLHVRGTKEPVETLIGFLSKRQTLLVLDNFERVVDAAPLIARLLRACPGLTVLATSRAPLRISGEREFLLAPLPLPSPDTPIDLGQNATAAVALFVERAQAIRPDFKLTEGNVETVAEICRRLDGLPLAIELAAARIGVLSPQAIAAVLDHRLRILSGGPRDAADRQRTMRDSIAWSYDLLTPAEQTLFRHMSVFVGGWTLESADGIAGGDIDVLDGLAALKNQSLINALEQPDGSVRFSMLETIRAFGLERLEQDGDATQLYERFVRYFRGVVERAANALQGPDQERWLHQLDTEHDNLRLMLDWTLDHGRVEITLQVAHALGSYWQSRGHLHEARRWLYAALTAADTVPVATTAAGFTQLGMIARELGDLDESQQLLSDALALFRKSGDEVGSLHTVSNLGWIAMYRGEYATSHRLQEEALRIARASGDPHLLAETLADVAIGFASVGEYSLANALAEEGAELARRLKDRRVEARAVLYLGCLALWQGEVDRAAELAELSLAISIDLDDSRVVFAFELLGFVALERGDADRAVELFSESLRRNQHARSLMRFAVSFEGLAGALAASGNPARGARFIGVAAALRDASGAKVFPGRRAGYERTLRTLHASLPDDVFDIEVAAGRDMSLEDALSVALDPDASALPVSVHA